MILMIAGKQAVEGMAITTSKGEKGVLKGWRAPHKPSSSGKVHVQLEDNTYQSEFFPSVISGMFVKVIPKNTYIRLEKGQDDKVSEEFGPFEWVQLTYLELRVSPDGDSFAYYSNGYWYIEKDEALEEYSDVIIFSN